MDEIEHWKARAIKAENDNHILRQLLKDIIDENTPEPTAWDSRAKQAIIPGPKPQNTEKQWTSKKQQ